MITMVIGNYNVKFFQNFKPHTPFYFTNWGGPNFTTYKKKEKNEVAQANTTNITPAANVQ